MEKEYKVFSTESKIVNKDPYKFQAPCRVLVAGPTESGKTNFIMNVLLDDDAPWNYCFYFYSAPQPKYKILEREYKAKGKEISFISGIPENKSKDEQFDYMKTFRQKSKEGRVVVIIFDDLMKEIENSPWASKIYTAGCHHDNLSVFELCQRVMVNREQRLQCDYVVLFNFPMDQKAIFALAQQLEPLRYKEVMQMYEQATVEHKRGWLLIDARCVKHGKSHLKYRCNSFNELFDWK